MQSEVYFFGAVILAIWIVGITIDLKIIKKKVLSAPLSTMDGDPVELKESLKGLLQEAVSDDRYEEAAVLRDAINKLSEIPVNKNA